MYQKLEDKNLQLKKKKLKLNSTPLEYDFSSAFKYVSRGA